MIVIAMFQIILSPVCFNSVIDRPRLMGTYTPIYETDSLDLIQTTFESGKTGF